jgi:hypothetical protein
MLKEYMAIQKNAATRPHLELLEPIQEDDLLHWQAILLGTADSAYEGGRFKLDIVIPTSYPIQSPTIRFVTKICHPNVHFKVKKDFVLQQTMTLGFRIIDNALSSISCFARTQRTKASYNAKEAHNPYFFLLGLFCWGTMGTMQRCTVVVGQKGETTKGKKMNSSKLFGSLGNWAWIDRTAEVGSDGGKYLFGTGQDISTWQHTIDIKEAARDGQLI